MPANPQESPVRRPARAVLESPESYAATLLVLFIDMYGAEALQWEPETIHRQLREDTGANIPRPNFDRLMAGVFLVTTDQFYSQLSRFQTICEVLDGDIFEPSVVSLPDAEECAWGVTEAMFIMPPEPDQEFDDEIKAYVTRVLLDDGYINPPQVLKGAVMPRFAELVTFPQDPEMMETFYPVRESKAEDLDAIVEEDFQDMLRQIEGLPLRNGQVDNLPERLRQSLTSAAE